MMSGHPVQNVPVSAEVVVVGSGMAGSNLAWKLAKSDLDVLILEAGPRVSQAAILENFRSSAFQGDYQSPYPPAPWAPHPQFTPMENGYPVRKGDTRYVAHYLRLAGGTTWHYSGQAWRMLPSDFHMKSLFGTGRDWSLDYHTLEPYYLEAETLWGVSGSDEDSMSPRSGPYPMPALPLSTYDRSLKKVLEPAGYQLMVEPAARNTVPYHNRPACNGSNNCAPICPSGAMYHGGHALAQAERAGARLVTNAVVHNIEADGRGRIQAVHYKDPTGNSHRVTGRHFILAANAVETAKLLLMSASSRYPDGIANSSDQVGRNLTDHPGTGVTFYARDPVWPGRGPMHITCIKNFFDGPFRADHSAYKIYMGNYSPMRAVTEELLKKGLSGPELDEQIMHYAARKVTFKSFFDLPPHPENRVVLSRDFTDPLGLPYPEVHFDVDDYVRRGAASCRKHYERFVRLFEGGEVDFQDDYFINHHMMGTTIMGDDPRDSVVNGDLRCHDHPNLYIVSGSVMPGCGMANCTLSIGALALRLGDSLARSAGKTPANALEAV